MPSNYLAQVRFTRTNGLPEDDVVNTWHFAAVGDKLPADTAAVISRLTTFYNGPIGGSTAVAAYLSTLLADAVTVKIYDLNDPMPRAPVVTGGFTLNSGRTTTLPTEVALCLSFRGALISGTNPARRRGRVYLGPLGSTAMGVVVGPDVRPVAALRTNVKNAAAALLAANTADLQWVVWSQADSAVVPVLTGYVDDAFDTQRRRGAVATNRLAFP